MPTSGTVHGRLSRRYRLWLWMLQNHSGKLVLGWRFTGAIGGSTACANERERERDSGGTRRGGEPKRKGQDSSGCSPGIAEARGQNCSRLQNFSSGHLLHSARFGLFAFACCAQFRSTAHVCAPPAHEPGVGKGCWGRTRKSCRAPCRTWGPRWPR